MKMITLSLPDGVKVPDGMESGDIFQAMTSYKLMDGGKVQLCEIDDEPVEGYKDDEGSEPNSSEDDSTQSMTQSMQDRIMGMSGPKPA